MRYQALICDYDGTIARGGQVDDATLEGLRKVRASGRKLLLATGRQLPDLRLVFGHLGIFDAVVAENGAVLFKPDTREESVLCEAPPPELARRLAERGVQPLSTGEVSVATWTPFETTVIETIQEMGLELQVIFNKGAVMVLPSGVNKASGVAAALADLGLSAHNAVAVGDAENDHAMLALCECGVAVSNAVPKLKERADMVTAADHGAGVLELVEALLASDLRELEPRLERHEIALGQRTDGRELRLPQYGAKVLIAGSSGGGKSTLATAFLERLTAAGYQHCTIDPEGDYGELDGAVIVGDAHRSPSRDELLALLARPDMNAVVNLLGVPMDERPAYFASLLPHLEELRSRLGRPHWIVVDEAHHVAPRDRKAPAPRDVRNLMLLTVHPEHLVPSMLTACDLVVTTGREPARTMASFADALGRRPPHLPEPDGDEDLALGWMPRSTEPPFWFRTASPEGERRRHLRKYADGELPPERSFYFRGPEGKLNLRAQNLMTFLDLADGVDDDTWRHHMSRGDYSAWFRRAIKDDGLAEAVAGLEHDPELSPGEGRRRIRALVEERYTAPA